MRRSPVRSGSFSLSLVIGHLVWRCGVAGAAIRDDELLDLLSWVLIVPLGIFQMLAAVWIKRQIEKSVLGLTVLATLASLAGGIAAAAMLDDRTIRPVMLALYFGPGLPTFVALAWRRLWAPALFLFLSAPGLLAILPR